MQGHEGKSQQSHFLSDGTRVVSGSDDKTVRVWDAVSGTAIMTPFQGMRAQSESVVFSSGRQPHSLYLTP